MRHAGSSPVVPASVQPAEPGVTPVPGADRRLLSSASGTRLEAFGPAEWGLLAAVASIWGSSFLFIAIGLEAFSPFVVTFARVGLGTLALTLIPRARRPIAREDRAGILVLGVVWIAVPLTLFPLAQQSIDSSVAGMINAAVPLTTAAWATLLLRRLPGRRQLVGIAVGFLGVLAVFVPELRGSGASAIGALLALGAVTCYGLAANLAVGLQQRNGALPVLWRAQLVALVGVAPLGIAGLDDSVWSWSSALAMVPLGVLGTGLALVLMTVLVGRVGAPRGSIAIYFTPLVALALGVVIRSEQVAPLALAGTALVLAGAWLTSRREG